MLRKSFLALLITALFASCGNDDSRSCTTCSSDQTTAFEVCREQNGDASVNGEDTNTDYDQYILDLEETGATCGE